MTVHGVAVTNGVTFLSCSILYSPGIAMETCGQPWAFRQLLMNSLKSFCTPNPRPSGLFMGTLLKLSKMILSRVQLVFYSTHTTKFSVRFMKVVQY